KAIGERRLLGALAGGDPLALVAEPLVDRGTRGLRVVPGHHPGRMGPLLVRVFIFVDAEPPPLHLGHAFLARGELVADRDVVLWAVFFLQALSLDARAV